MERIERVRLTAMKTPRAAPQWTGIRFPRLLEVFSAKYTQTHSVGNPCTAATFYIASAGAAISLGSEVTVGGEALFPEIKGGAEALKAAKAYKAFKAASPYIAAGTTAAKFAGLLDNLTQKVSNVATWVGNKVQSGCNALE